MHIFYASPSIIPSPQANAVHVMKMAQAFADNGHHVTLFAAPGDMSGDVYDFYGVRRNFDIVYVPRRGPGPIWNLFYALDIIGHLRTALRVDVVYGRHLYTLALCAILARDTPLIYESHMMPEGRIRHAVERWLLRHRNLRRLVVISDVLRRDYCDAFPALDPGRVVVAHDAADPVDVDSPAALPGRAGVLRACYAGRLITGKGMGVIAGLVAACPEIDFHIYGGSKEEIKSWRAQMNAPANAHFHGHMPPAVLPAHYAAADIMLAPLQPQMALDKGRHDIGRWTSPLKIFEYMAAGKPIVCSDLPVLREILHDEENALLCPHDDVAAWAAALRRLAGDTNLVQTLARNAHEGFIARHTWRARARDVLSDH